MKTKFALFLVLGMFALITSACTGGSSSVTASNAVPPPVVALPSDAEATDQAIRFLEDRVKKDKDDFISYNKLAGYYLQRQREIGDINYLDLAFRAARASLEAMPEEQNLGGLSALVQAEQASHDFAAARDNAMRLMKLDPGKTYPYQMLGDALLELGDYNKVADIFREMKKRSDGSGIQIRLARLALLQGKTDEAKEFVSNALALAMDQRVPSRETIAWCHWQLGEICFSTGDYQKAERHYENSLTTFPDYYRGLASLGKVRAALGDLNGAIEKYERATRILPDPAFVAALGDLYKIAGREKDAQTQYALVEQIGKIGKASDVLYNRQIALFYADHDKAPEEAYNQARLEYEKRQDIYGADALAWTALKAGKIADAQTSIKEALKLGTRDAKLFYHAGMIAKAAGDNATAADYLKRALTLNPQFDALQALQAKQALESLN